MTKAKPKTYKPVAGATAAEVNRVISQLRMGGGVNPKDCKRVCLTMATMIANLKAKNDALLTTLGLMQQNGQNFR